MASVVIAPYEVQPVSSFIQKELKRREREMGFNFVNAEGASWDDEGNWKDYKGPLCAWVRVCSNGISDEKYGTPPKEGFVMHGVSGFYNDYGFDPKTKSPTQTLLGFTPDGQEHKIDSEYVADSKNPNINKHVPPPGVISVDSSIQKDCIQAASIKWKCHSLNQLEYLTPFFLTPNVTMILEWGWNHFNPECLLDLNDVGHPTKYKENMADKTIPEQGDSNNPNNTGDPDDPVLEKGHGLIGIFTDSDLQYDRIKKGKGLYQLICGKITNFEFSLQPDGSYDCTTDIKSWSSIYSGAQTSNALAAAAAAASDGTKNPQPIKNLKEFFNVNFNKFPATLLDSINSTTKTPLYEGFIAPETRIFIPRNINVEKDPRTWKKNVSTYSFDSKPCDDFWISMGLFVDLINRFCTLEAAYNRTIRFNQIDIRRSWIGGHKNIISTDGKILLIPNVAAPTISPDVEDRTKSYTFKDSKYQSKTPNKNPNKSNEVSDKNMFSVLNTHTRQDLNEIINFFGHNYSNIDPISTAFPSPLPEHNYEVGKLENLFIHKDLAKDAVLRSDTMVDILKYTLDKISEAVNKFWNFQIVYPSNTCISVIDVDAFNVDRFMKASTDDAERIYYFKNLSTKNIIQSLNFSVKMSDKVAIQSMQNDSNVNKMSVSIKNPPPFDIKDRFFKKSLGDAYVKPADRETLESKRENEEKERTRIDQENAKRDSLLAKDKNLNDESFIYGEVESDTQVYIRKLVFTEKDLLTLLINDRVNPSVNNMPQPGIKIEMTLMGIAGFKTMQLFGVDNLPLKYSSENLYMVQDVKHSLQNGNWTTVLTAVLKPMKGLKIGQSSFEDAGDILK